MSLTEESVQSIFFGGFEDHFCGLTQGEQQNLMIELLRKLLVEGLVPTDEQKVAMLDLLCDERVCFIDVHIFCRILVKAGREDLILGHLGLRDMILEYLDDSDLAGFRKNPEAHPIWRGIKLYVEGLLSE